MITAARFRDAFVAQFREMRNNKSQEDWQKIWDGKRPWSDVMIYKDNNSLVSKTA
jgi:hypothetical protein